MADDSEPGTSSPGYGDRPDVYHVRYLPSSSVSLSTTIVEAIADLSNATVADLDPLYGAVDPDALCDLIAPDGGDRSASVGGIWFYYSGYEVTVYGSGDIEIRSIDVGSDAASQ